MSLNVTLNDQLLYPSEYIGAADLKGKDVVLTIDHVEVSNLMMAGGRAQKKPVVYFAKTTKKLVMNKTNAGTIAGLYGPKVESWAGQRIIVYPTTTRCGGNTVECVRVRDHKPGETKPAPVQEEELSGSASNGV